MKFTGFFLFVKIIKPLIYTFFHSCTMNTNYEVYIKIPPHSQLASMRASEGKTYFYIHVKITVFQPGKFYIHLIIIMKFEL